MARSTYIYMVVDSQGNLVAGFTVKHELMTWLSRHSEPGYVVWRVPDGGHRAPTEMIIDLGNGVVLERKAPDAEV